MSSRWFAVPVLALAVVAGCNKSGPGPKPSTVSTAPGPNASPEELKGSGEAFAKEFLAAASAGQSVAGRLAPEFKKVVAPPIPAIASDAEKKQGYSDAEADAWAKKVAAGRTFAPEADQTAVTANVAMYRGTAGSDAYTLRLTRDGGGWSVDWFAVTPKFASALPTGPADIASARFTAAAFLDAILAKNDAMAEYLVLSKARADLAPPRFEADKARGYSQSGLHALFAELRGTATGYKLTKVEGSIVRGELTGASGSRPLTVNVAGGQRPGESAIVGFQAK